jgi:ribonuclease HIII
MSNLNSILGWAHSKAIENLIVKNNEVENIIIDKFCNENVLESLFKKKSYKLNVIQVINAEQDLAVAAASILARSAFIDWLNRYEKRTGINLPKGVNDKVIKTGKTIYGKNGKEGLYEVAKVHFKTFNKVIN